MRIKEELVEVGEVWVDSGQLMICDPCYIKSDWNEDWDGERIEAIKKGKTLPDWGSYTDVCGVTLSDDRCGNVGGGMAFATSTYWGDGSYKVYANMHDGKIKGFYVDMYQEGEDEYDDGGDGWSW
jgi:hypothetical protein